eukprot:gene43723-54329_t
MSTSSDTIASDAGSIIRDCLSRVHGGRAGHFGVKRTWAMLNRLFPGHSVPVKAIQDFILECSVCQKDRDKQAASIPAATKTLHVEHS